MYIRMLTWRKILFFIKMQFFIIYNLICFYFVPNLQNSFCVFVSQITAEKKVDREMTGISSNERCKIRNLETRQRDSYRKSGIPAAVLIPAPVWTTTWRAPWIQSARRPHFRRSVSTLSYLCKQKETKKRNDKGEYIHFFIGIILQTRSVKTWLRNGRSIAGHIVYP